MIAVYHRNDPDFNNDPAAAKHFPVGFTKVAEVETLCKDKAFELTNHINRNWQTNPGVRCFTNGARSTSVGDVVVDMNDNRCYLVQSFGWAEITETGE